MLERDDDVAVATVTATGTEVILKNGDEYYIECETQSSITAQTLVRQPRTVSEVFEMNVIQRRLYRRLMYGLNDFSEEEIKGMPSHVIKKIAEDHERTQRILHIEKVKRHCRLEFKLLNAIFAPRYEFGKFEWDYIAVHLPKHVTLHRLGIFPKEICSILVKNKLLPYNFFNLSPSNITLK